MTDPYTVLGIPPDADDAAIRAQYLQLTREFPPEEHPEKSAAIRHAYDLLKDLDARVNYRLFAAARSETIDAIIEDVVCQTPRRRITLNELFRAAGISGR
ncbi:J domain-containing protein [Limnoglobus roseus]|uniref:Chaperone protein DnaJ n=1 Tax=Limnoglobus roseus TaxID=2598579 RepID=A0A5C1AJX7_9BACT|nr:DnaJ domain-containing protein [Limnoglobus roseus]QEL19699.1 Chaperone protein DnaJ [Limnoglobus roseus]